MGNIRIVLLLFVYGIFSEYAFSKKCYWMEWSAWSECNVQCGSGRQTRMKLMRCNALLNTCLRICGLDATSVFLKDVEIEHKACLKPCTHGIYNAKTWICQCPIGQYGECCTQGKIK